MKQALINGRIFTGDQWFSDRAVLMDEGLILDLCKAAELPADAELVDVQGKRLLPGLIDTQVNGGGGVLFNDAPTVESLRIIGEAHRRYGTTGFMPTLISDDLEVMARGIKAVAEARAQGLPGVLGIHLEGPFLNAERKGVHDDRKFRRLDEDAFKLLTSLEDGKTLVTLAPELTTPDMIRALVSAGVIVAAGHTAADYRETRDALSAGLSSFTHLFNAMTPMSSREPGVVGAALEDNNSWCGLIVDGYHVHPATLKVAIASKAAGKMLLVTDAMPTVGAENKSFVLKGETIHAVGGRCATADDTLAGSDLDMLSAVRNSMDKLGLPLEEGVRMASRYPAEMLGLAKEYGSLAPGYKANIICVDDDLLLNQSWINGTPMA